jgi:hypothetical protein
VQQTAPGGRYPPGTLTPLSRTRPSLETRRAEAVPLRLAIAHPTLSIARAEGTRVWGTATRASSRPWPIT